MKLLIALAIIVGSLSASALTKVKLGLNWKAEPEFGGFYAARDLGFYKEAGLDVEIIEGAAGVPTAQMVASKKIEFGITSGDHLILSRNNGADVKALMTVYQKSPQIVMVRADSGITSFKELMSSDYTISSIPGSLWMTFLQKKFPSKSVKVVPYQGGITNYLSDPKFAQQGFAGSEPELAEARGVKTRTLFIADEGFDNYAAILFTNGEVLKNGNLAKRFVEASRKGWNAYVKNPAETHKTIQKLNPAMDEKTIEAIFRVQKPLMIGKMKESELAKNFGQFSSERWELLLKQMLDLKVIKSSMTAKDLFTNL